MTSPEQEFVPFVKPVDPKNKNIEFWMGEVKDAMIGKSFIYLFINSFTRAVFMVELSGLDSHSWADPSFGGSMCHHIDARDYE